MVEVVDDSLSKDYRRVGRKLPDSTPWKRLMRFRRPTVDKFQRRVARIRRMSERQR